MEFTTTETNLIDQLIWATSELERDPLPSLCLALEIADLSYIVPITVANPTDPSAVTAALRERGHTTFDLEQYTELSQFVARRQTQIAESLSQLVLDQQRGPDSAELIQFPHHRTIQ